MRKIKKFVVSVLIIFTLCFAFIGCENKPTNETPPASDIIDTVPEGDPKPTPPPKPDDTKPTPPPDDDGEWTNNY